MADSSNNHPLLPPLYERLRPTSLNDILGQGHLVAEQGGVFRGFLREGRLPSVLFVGPPGTGKTSLARILAATLEFPFRQISATTSGAVDLKKIFGGLSSSGHPLVLFVDEIHRFNKAVQDILLPPLEDGRVVLIGATTENPGFALRNALLSRLTVYHFQPLSEVDIKSLLSRGLALAGRAANADLLTALAQNANGDGRRAVNQLEALILATTPEVTLSLDQLKILNEGKMVRYDRDGDYHFDLISALHKSMRGSDIEASLYWAGRMVEGGEPPLYLFRRLARFAMEDVGLADPEAIGRVLACRDAFQFLGEPEGMLAVWQAVVYLATAPKSNSLYRAEKELQRFLQTHGDHPVPNQLRNAPTSYARDLNHAVGYLYPHDFPFHFVLQDYHPTGVPLPPFYQPGEFGHEKTIRQRQKFWERLKGAKGER